MRDTLRALAAAGKTVFVSSHILSEVQQLADVVGILARGRLVREGKIETLLREEGMVRVRVTPAEVPVAGPALEAVAGPGAVVLEQGPEAGWLAVRFDPGRAAELNRALAAAGVFAGRIEGGTTLETLFLDLTGTAPDVGQRTAVEGAPA
jgi:ABC-2 type transport system ATP-binding protein